MPVSPGRDLQRGASTVQDFRGLGLLGYVKRVRVQGKGISGFRLRVWGLRLSGLFVENYTVVLFSQDTSGAEVRRSSNGSADGCRSMGAGLPQPRASALSPQYNRSRRQWKVQQWPGF